MASYINLMRNSLQISDKTIFFQDMIKKRLWAFRFSSGIGNEYSKTIALNDVKIVQNGWRKKLRLKSPIMIGQQEWLFSSSINFLNLLQKSLMFDKWLLKEKFHFR